MVAPVVFDRGAVRRHRDRAAGTVGTVAPVLQDLAERLLDRLDDVRRSFEVGLEIGGRGVVAPMLRGRGIEVVSTDLSPRLARVSGAPCVAMDEEAVPFAAGSFDLVVACMSLHWVNDLPGALVQLRQVLRPGGLFLASMPALGSLDTMREALAAAEYAVSEGVSPRVSPFPALSDLAALLQRAGFSLPVADVEEVALSYADPLALVRDLRAAGESNAVALRRRAIPRREMLARGFGGMVGPDGRVGVTLRVATMTGWA